MNLNKLYVKVEYSNKKQTVEKSSLGIFKIPKAEL